MTNSREGISEAVAAPAAMSPGEAPAVGLVGKGGLCLGGELRDFWGTPDDAILGADVSHTSCRVRRA